MFALKEGLQVALALLFNLATNFAETPLTADKLAKKRHIKRKLLFMYWQGLAWMRTFPCSR